MSARRTGLTSLARAALQVAGLELRTALRDRQTLVYTVVLPFALYPVLFWGILQGVSFVEARARGTAVRVEVVAAEGETVPEELRTALETEVSGGPDASSGALRAEVLPALPAAAAPPGEADLAASRDDAAGDDALLAAARRRLEAADGPDALLVLPPAARLADGAEPTLFHDTTDGRSELARERVAARLAAHATTLRERALDREGKQPRDLEAFALDPRNLASERDMGAFLLSFLLPMMLIFMAVMGAFIPAVDCTAGEKERGTAETTLLAPVPRLALHLGKLAAVSTTSLIATVLNVAGIALAARHLVGMLGERTLSISVPLAPLLATLPIALLFIVFSSALLLAVASLADTFKQGQSMLGSVQLVFLGPAVAGALPGLTLTPGLALVPVLQVVLAFKSILQGDGAATPLTVSLLVGSLLVYTGLVLAATLWLLSRESVRTGSMGRAPWRVLFPRLGRARESA